jgi:hypothetical protein
VGAGASGSVRVITPGGTGSLPGFIWLNEPLVNSWSGIGNWNSPSNWSFGFVPQITDKAKILSGNVQVAENVQIRCLYTMPGSQVSLLSDKTLSVTDTIQIGGEISGQGFLSATGTQPVLMQTTSGRLHNLRIQAIGESRLITPFRIRGTLKLWSPLITNDLLELESGPGYSGRIAKIEFNAGADLIGKVNWQRYVPGPAAWHFIGTPIQNQNLSNWTDDFQVGNGFFYLHNEGGTLQTGNQVNGWEESNMGGVVGKGYRIFLSNSFVDNNPRFDNSGPITKGNFSFPVSFSPEGYDGGGWNFLSNPYPCEISWSDLIRSPEVDAAIYIYNQTAYGAYSAGSGISVNGVGNHISQGQGFFVKLNGPGGSILATEDAKPESDMAQGFLRLASGSYPVIKLRLSNATGLSDELAISDRPDADAFFNAQLDAHKFSAAMAISAVTADGISSAIQCLKLDSLEPTTIPLKLRVPVNGTYKLDCIPESGNLEYRLYLRDLDANSLTFLPYNQTISLDLEQGNWENRFELLIVPQTQLDIRLAQSTEVRIFPCPAGNWLMVEGENISGISVRNILGQEMQLPPAQKKENGWLLPELNLPSGIYRMEIRKGNNLLFSSFVKE